MICDLLEIGKVYGADAMLQKDVAAYFPIVIGYSIYKLCRRKQEFNFIQLCESEIG
jgi:hypothetical protein